MARLNEREMELGVIGNNSGNSRSRFGKERNQPS